MKLYSNKYHKKNHFLDRKTFTTPNKFSMLSTQSQKTTASRDKLKIYKANSTPMLNRAFFVRNFRTPQERPERLSMVERSRQPLAVGYFPVMVVFHPVTLYRQTVESQAVVPKNYSQDTATMIYKYLCANRTRPNFSLEKLTITANSEETARHSLSADYRIIALTARINPKNHRTLSTQGGVYA